MDDLRRLCDRLGVQPTGDAITDLTRLMAAMIEGTGAHVAYRRVWDSQLKTWVKDSACR